VAVGLQIDPAAIATYWPVVLALSVLTIVGKVGTCALATILAGYPAATALRVGLGLGQIGEFSFIIANLGQQAGVISGFLYPVTVAVSAVTTLTTPYEIRYAERAAALLGRVTPGLIAKFVRFYGEQFGAAAAASSSPTGRRVRGETLRFAFVLVVAVMFLVIASPLIPSGMPLILTLVMVALASVVLWRSARRLRVRAEEVLGKVFSEGPEEGEEIPVERRKQLADLVSEKYPFEVVVEDVILPLHETAANRSIREIGLRSETGATIAAIYRAESANVNPDPETTLLPGDVILLFGSRGQIGRAVRYLASLSARPPK
jgi:hypothetical protein